MPQARFNMVRGLLALALSALACGALAQTYPAKPVRLIVTYPPAEAPT
jgi:tripartite-type tricarboxylate transporter receptor subunit TctC